VTEADDGPGAVDPPSPPAPVGGSFRDPRSRVYDDGTRILRGLNRRAAADFEAVAQTGFFHLVTGAGQLVATSLDPHHALAPHGWTATLEHERLPVVTYPYEWTFSMLRDAALLHLDLVRRGLAMGVGCKDGTAYNVQFAGSAPVFIDLGSFEPVGADPWPGYRQFCQQLLYPLLIEAYLDVPFNPWLRGSLEGITPQQADRLLRGRTRLRRGVLAHVTAQAFAARRYTDRDDPAASTTAGDRKRIVSALVARLHTLIAGLPAPAAESTWSSYPDRSHYAAEALAAKDAFVGAAIGAVQPATVVDLGCNDGRYARLAAERGAAVVALDADRQVVDRLYRDLRRTGGDLSRSIVPLVSDLADPSPRLGWGLEERAALEDRVRPDLVLSLALIHHLVIGRNIPIASYLDALAAMAPEVVLEIPHRDDPMVQRLLSAKPDDTHTDYDVPRIADLVRARFDVVAEEVLPGGTRTLQHLRSRRPTASP